VSICPFAKWRGPLPSGAYSRGPVTKIGCAVHVVVGSEDSANAEFHNGLVGLSATSGIADGNDGDDVDGALTQWIDNRDICYAMRDGNWPRPGGNGSYNAVEVGGTPDVPMTPAQLVSLEAWLRWDSADCGYPLTSVVVPHGTPGITTHCNPDGSADPAWGDHVCPGPIRLQQVRDMLARIASPPAPPPSSDDDLFLFRLLGGPMALALSDDDARHAAVRLIWNEATRGAGALHGAEPTVDIQSWWAGAMASKGLDLTIAGIRVFIAEHPQFVVHA